MKKIKMSKKEMIKMLNDMKDEVEILKATQKAKDEARVNDIEEIKVDVAKNNEDTKRLSQIYITNSILKPNLAFMVFEHNKNEDGTETVENARLYKLTRVTDSDVTFDFHNLRTKATWHQEEFDGLGYMLVTRTVPIDYFINNIYNPQYDKDEDPTIVKKHIGKTKTNAVIEAMQARDVNKFLETVLSK